MCKVPIRMDDASISFNLWWEKSYSYDVPRHTRTWIPALLYITFKCWIALRQVPLLVIIIIIIILKYEGQTSRHFYNLLTTKTVYDSDLSSLADTVASLDTKQEGKRNVRKSIHNKAMLLWH